MNNNLNSDIARYIWHIISLDPYLPMSWGVEEETMVASENSLEFKVSGFIFEGNVRVTYIEGADLFQVCLYSTDGELEETIDDVYLDNLADTIDQKVEKCDGYEDAVMKYLCIGA